jgi:hypothetical protein
VQENAVYFAQKAHISHQVSASLAKAHAKHAFQVILASHVKKVFSSKTTEPAVKVVFQATL